MSRNIKYNTKQKEIILKIIKKQNKEFQIKDIYEKAQDNIGLTTIYRLIDNLTKENIIKKTIGKDGKNYYQYLEKCQEENHFYLKCNKCKKITHIDCDCIKELSEHILKKHKFNTDKKNIIISGICEKCREVI